MMSNIETSGVNVFITTYQGGVPHRRTVVPGAWENGAWVTTDISGESGDVQTACNAAWTPSAVSAYQAMFPWVEAASPEPHLNGGMLLRFAATNPVVVHENLGLAGVTRVAKGRYRINHSTPLASDSYSVVSDVLDLNVRWVRATARTANYVEVRITDQTGVAQDANEVTVKIERVI